MNKNEQNQHLKLNTKPFEELHCFDSEEEIEVKEKNQIQKQQSQCSDIQQVDIEENDEIKETDDVIQQFSSTYLFHSGPNSNHNINNIETNESLSKAVLESSLNNLQISECNTQSPAIKEKVYLKSCGQIDQVEESHTSKKKHFLQIKTQQVISPNNSSHDSPSPRRYIQKRVSMRPLKNQHYAGEEISSPNRRQSLPDFKEVEKEPQFSTGDMYKIYMGDAIDEQQGGDGDVIEQVMQPDEFQYDLDEGSDCIDEGELENEFHYQKHIATTNPINKLKEKNKFKYEKEEEDAAETPIQKFSKFSEDRFFVQQKKIENGGVTPQKYQNEQKSNFKAFQY